MSKELAGIRAIKVDARYVAETAVGKAKPVIIGPTLADCYEIALQRPSPVGGGADLIMRQTLEARNFEVKIVPEDIFRKAVAPFEQEQS